MIHMGLLIAVETKQIRTLTSHIHTGTAWFALVANVFNQSHATGIVHTVILEFYHPSCLSQSSEEYIQKKT